ncbi:hypothetical protein AB0I81_59090 [Nonomuraea sp. NPDC050404]|uniref:hypothetical protein n=1 Tax=Nonomuraea sp. NPDC050404 TaxID=3155783 RepID=UPI003411AF71
MMMRAVARGMLRLYPAAWRERYGEEVADLIEARPARLRTVADLVRGAGDAWLHHRRIPGARPLRPPLAAVLVAGLCGLWLLWGPAVGGAARLEFSVAQAADVGWLFRTATSCFTAAGAMALLSPWQLGIAARAAGKRAPYGVQARTAGRRVLRTAVVVACPIVLVLGFYLVLELTHPFGALGDAMAAGFFVPTLMVLVLPLPLIAASSPAIAGAARAAGKSLAVAAMLNAIAWLTVTGLLALGLGQASPWYVTSVAAGALVSTGLTALVARTVLRRAPYEPELSPIPV